MKVATQAPAVTKRPVYVTSEIYEIWYAKPMSLGKIHNVKGYWYTSDQMRFISSRDAMEYLIRMAEASSPIERAAIQQVQKPASEKPSAVAPVGRHLGPTHPATTTTTSKPSIRKPTLPGPPRTEPINQNHPAFQEFLEFRNWQAKQKASKVLEQ